MVSDDLYDLLIDYCAEVNTKIVFVGDKAQINPVGIEEKSSKVFDSPNIVSLTKLQIRVNSKPILPRNRCFVKSYSALQKAIMPSAIAAANFFW